MQQWNDNRWMPGQYIRSIDFQTMKTDNDDDDIIYDIQLNCCVRI